MERKGSPSRVAAWTQKPREQVGRHTHAHCPDRTLSSEPPLPTSFLSRKPTVNTHSAGSLSGTQAQSSGQFSLDLMSCGWGYLAICRPGSGSHGHSTGKSVTCDLDMGREGAHVMYQQARLVHTGTHI